MTRPSVRARPRRLAALAKVEGGQRRLRLALRGGAGDVRITGHRRERRGAGGALAVLGELRRSTPGRRELLAGGRTGRGAFDKSKNQSRLLTQSHVFTHTHTHTHTTAHRPARRSVRELLRPAPVMSRAASPRDEHARRLTPATRPRKSARAGAQPPIATLIVPSACASGAALGSRGERWR